MASNRVTRRWMMGSVFAIAAAAIGALALTQRSAADDSKDTTSLKGKAAPEIALPTADGKSVKLSDQKGKVVLIDFWATWCGPCVKSLPHINHIAENAAYKEKGLQVWAVNVREKAEQVKAFLAQRKMSLTAPLDAEGKTGTAYLVEGIPTTVLIGKDGKVLNVWVGVEEGTAKEQDAAIEAALK
jgi:cytochrome c biogenesis protein CcmG/thiol:disulfide interchange protein DsbE